MRTSLLLAALALSLTTNLAIAHEPRPEVQLTGQVISITDGDTLTLLDADKTRIKIRLAEIDTPEKNQPYGQRAKQELASLTFRRQAQVSVIDIDRYGRMVGRVVVDGLDVNAEMVRRGAAWVYRHYLKRSELLALEADAKQAGKGLWALPETERVPPWQWRKAERSKRAAVDTPEAAY